MLEPPPPPPGVEPDQDDIGIKFKSFDLNKVEHEPPRTLAGYEAEVNVWPIFKFTYMKIISLMIFYFNLQKIEDPNMKRYISADYVHRNKLFRYTASL